MPKVVYSLTIQSLPAPLPLAILLNSNFCMEIPYQYLSIILKFYWYEIALELLRHKSRMTKSGFQNFTSASQSQSSSPEIEG